MWFRREPSHANRFFRVFIGAAVFVGCSIGAGVWRRDVNRKDREQRRGETIVGENTGLLFLRRRRR